MSTVLDKVHIILVFGLLFVHRVIYVQEDDSDLPGITVFGEHKHVAAFLVYVDGFLAAGPREILKPLLTRLLDVWKGSNPDLLERQPGDVDTMRFLGLDIELGPEEGIWLIHQQSYINAFL